MCGDFPSGKMRMYPLQCFHAVTDVCGPSGLSSTPKESMSIICGVLIDGLGNGKGVAV